MSYDNQPTVGMPEWVMQLRSHGQKANIGVALDVADAVLSLAEADVPPPVGARLRAIIERADSVGAAVPIAIAARLLSVSGRTARSWAEGGALTAVAEQRARTVSARSLGQALAATTVIRHLGRDQVALRRALDVLEDQRARLDLAGRIEELGSRVPVEHDRLGDLFADAWNRCGRPCGGKRWRSSGTNSKGWTTRS